MDWRVFLGLAVAGVVGFLFVRSELCVAADPFARIGIAAALTIALAQALAALWFFKLFRNEDNLAAGTVAALGLTVGELWMIGYLFFGAQASDRAAGRISPVSVP
ncbi:MAG: hypothetical protein ACN4GZ_13820 [Acidimicrobiales bacterium]